MISWLKSLQERRGPLLSRLLAGTFWNAIASVLNQGGTFLITVLVARLLGKTTFGQYAIVQSTLLSISVLAQAGITYSATKHIAEFRSVDKEKTGRMIGLCAVVCPILALAGALIVAFSSRFVALHALGSSQLAMPLALGAVYVLFTAVNWYQTGALIGLERYRALAAPAAISTVITVALVMGGCLLAGLNGAVAGFSGGAAVRWLAHHRVLKRELEELGIQVHYRDIWREASMVYDFAIPAALSGYLIMPALWFANGLLVRQPSGYAQMGVYSVAQTLRVMVMFAPLLMNSVGLSILNNARRGEQARAYGSVRKMNLRLLTGVTAVLAVALALGGKVVLRFFGSAYAEAAYPVLLILLASTVVESAFLGLYQVLQSGSHMWAALGTVTFPWQAAFAISAWKLIPRFGASGFACSYLAGVVVALGCTAAVVSVLDRRGGAGAFACSAIPETP